MDKHTPKTVFVHSDKGEGGVANAVDKPASMREQAVKKTHGFHRARTFLFTNSKDFCACFLCFLIGKKEFCGVATADFFALLSEMMLVQLRFDFAVGQAVYRVFVDIGVCGKIEGEMA